MRFKGKTRVYYVRRVRCTFNGCEVMLARIVRSIKRKSDGEVWRSVNDFELVKEG